MSEKTDRADNNEHTGAPVADGDSPACAAASSADAGGSLTACAAAASSVDPVDESASGVSAATVSGTAASTGASFTTDDLIERFGMMRHSLQRWHEAYRRVYGGPAADPLRGQGRVLALLDMQGEMRQRDMGYSLNIRPQSLGEVLAKLERSGYIERRVSERDRRVLLVSITESGRACIKRRRPPFPPMRFTDEEVNQFVVLIDRAMGVVDESTIELNAMSPQDSAPEEGIL